MDLYQILAEQYSQIFPSSQQKLEFVEALLLQRKILNILDIGCASGEFAIQLASDRRNITGIDLDLHMIEEAKSQITADTPGSVEFLTTEMVKFLQEIEAGSFDAIVCMGNTIAYLDGEAGLARFLDSSYHALVDNGRLILQILNYSNPDIGSGFKFLQLESPKFLFNRSYGELNSQSGLQFQTTVYDKATGEVHSDIHTHYPFTVTQIEELAVRSGFSRVQIYGGYDKKKLEAGDFFVLMVAGK